MENKFNTNCLVSTHSIAVGTIILIGTASSFSGMVGENINMYEYGYLDLNTNVLTKFDYHKREELFAFIDALPYDDENTDLRSDVNWFCYYWSEEHQADEDERAEREAIAMII